MRMFKMNFNCDVQTDKIKTKIKSSLGKIDNLIAIKQQEYLQGELDISSISQLHNVIRAYDKNNRANINIYGVKENKIELLHTGAFMDIPYEYEELSILPWNEEIRVLLKPRTMYVYVKYDQSVVDFMRDQATRIRNIDENGSQLVYGI